jgi:predicted phosphodiesterase
MSRVLVIGDLHLPASHPEYYDFIKSVKRKHKTDTTVFIGDIVDHNAISFHKKSPESMSAQDEYGCIKEGLKKWKKLFPEAMVCIGNHDERVHRLGTDAGIPSVYIKKYEDVWSTPEWSWQYSHTIDGVGYSHGTGTSGMSPAFNSTKITGQSWVMGHTHSVANISWLRAHNGNMLFGMNVGSGVDATHIAMNYTKNHIKKPIISAGVVIDGHPYLEMMA